MTRVKFMKRRLRVRRKEDPEFNEYISYETIKGTKVHPKILSKDKFSNRETGCRTY